MRTRTITAAACVLACTLMTVSLAEQAVITGKDRSCTVKDSSRAPEPDTGMKNSIHNLDTKWSEAESGSFPAIVMGLNIREAESAPEFIRYASEQFVNQRMCSPPEIDRMVVTVAGVINAKEFREQWMLATQDNPVLKHFMSLMVSADVLHIESGKVLDEATLIGVAGQDK